MKAAEIIKNLLYKDENLVSCIKAIDCAPLKFGAKNLYLALTNVSLIIFSESETNTYIERYMLDEIEKISERNELWVIHFYIVTKNGKKRKINFKGESRKILKDLIIPEVENFMMGIVTQSELKTYKRIKATISKDKSNNGKLLLGKIVGQNRVLSDKAIKAIEENIYKGEKVLFCLLGYFNQTIIALKGRLLVIKPGRMAGATFGARATSFRYKDITAIEVNTGALNGVIEICTPSYQGTKQKDFWAISRDRDPSKVSNCLPIAKDDLKKFKPYLSYLEKRINRAEVSMDRLSKNTAEQDIATQLEKVTQLFKSGALNKEEFESSKKRVLGIN